MSLFFRKEKKTALNKNEKKRKKERRIPKRKQNENSQGKRERILLLGGGKKEAGSELTWAETVVGRRIGAGAIETDEWKEEEEGQCNQNGGEALGGRWGEKRIY